MAQHDYVIANGTGAAVRSDLNNALAAIVSQNSGATEPATMYAYQWWADTTTGLLKLRNGANNAWITLRELDGTLTIEDGTAGAPGLAFADDLNTGVFSPGADQVAFTAGGTARLTATTTGITSALPVDVPLGSASAPTVTFTGDLNTGIYSPGADQVAVATNGTGRLFVNSSGSVGIGTSAPNAILSVKPSASSTTGATTFTGDAIYIDCANTTNANGSYGGAISWSRAGISTTRQAAITNVQTGSDPDVQGLAFLTHSSASGTDPLIEAMRITGVGNVGIGVTGPQHLCQIAGTLAVDSYNDTTKTITLRPGFEANANGGMGLQAKDHSGAAPDGLGIYGTDGVSVMTANAGTFFERLRVDTSGRLLVGTSSARSYFSGGDVPGLQLEGTGTEGRELSVTASNSGVSGAVVLLGKQRSGTIGGNTVVQNNDQVGLISYQGSDGTKMLECARVEALIDGTPGANDMPGRLVFSTTADGASSPTERFRLEANGNSRFSNGEYVFPNVDNTIELGSSTNRWQAVWAANGTIQTSDQRAKVDIANATLGSDFIKALRPISYKWIEGGKRDTGVRDQDGNWIYESVPGERTHWGFIAQEVKQVVDAAGVDFGGWVLTDKDDPESQQALRYDQFIAPLTKALQEALAEIDVLKAKVTALESA